MTGDPGIAVFRPDRPGIRKVLGDLEAEIMELIWARPPEHGTTVRDVFQNLYARRRIAYTTVMTTMARLAKKQLLLAASREPAYVYRTRFTEEEFVARFVGRILEDLLASFFGTGVDRRPTPADADTVDRRRQLLDEIARRRARANE